MLDSPSPIIESPSSVVTDLEIDVNLAQIPEPQPCTVCEASTRKKLVAFEQPYTRNGQRLVARANVPGYVCDTCDVEFYSLLGSIKAFEAARDVVQKAQDENTLKYVEASLEAMRQTI